MLSLIICLIFPALLIYAAAHDVATMTIPNWVSILLALAFLPAAAVAGLSLSETGLHLGVGAIALIAGAALFYMGVWGGGDAKLIAAAAIWLGASGGLPFLYGVAIVGGALAFVLIVARRLQLKSSVQWLSRLLSPTEGAPYGVAIAGGAIWAAGASPVFADALRTAGIAG